jgi:hypothetical protein
MEYFHTFYCEDLGVDLECELEVEDEDLDVGLQASMTLISACIKSEQGLDIFPVLSLGVVDEIEASALKEAREARTTGHDYF